MDTPYYHHQASLVCSFFCLSMVPQLTAQTWDGSSSKIWSDAANWTPSGIPAAGADISVQNTTTNNGIWLDIDRDIGAFNFGTRTSTFEVQTGPGRFLTIHGNLSATGNFTANGLPLGFRGNYVVDSPQQWIVEGSAGDEGSTGDRGAGFRATEEGVTPGSVLLESDLTKLGSGQLSLVGTSLSGAGDLVVSDGALKLNAGSGLSLVVEGPGAIRMNESSKLFTARNSGTFGAWTRPIFMTGNSSWSHGGGQIGNNVVSSPVSWTGAGHNLTVGNFLAMSGGWSGNATVQRGGTGTLILSGDSTGFTGLLNNASGITRIDGVFHGSVAVLSGSLRVNATTAGNVNANGSTADVALLDQTSPALISGSLSAGSYAKVSGEGLVAQGILLNGARLAVRPETPARLKAGGDVTLSALDGQTEILLEGSPASGQPFAVFEHGGALILGEGGVYTDYLRLAGGDSNYRNPVFSKNPGNPKQVDLRVNTANLTWIGPAGGAWSLVDPDNWSGGTPPGFHHMDSVTFSDATAAFDVVMTEPLLPGLVRFNTSAGKSSTISSNGSGALSGPASIEKNGPGTVSLGGANTQDFTGPVTVNGGKLVMNSDGAFGRTSGIAVASGGQVDLNGKQPADAGSGSFTFQIEGTGPDGQGALVNSQPNNTSSPLKTDAGVRSLVLTGPAKIKSTGRFDVGFDRIGGPGTITGNNHTLTVETETFSVGTTPTGRIGMAFMGDASGSDLHLLVAAGVVWAQDSDKAFGGPSSTLTIAGGARAGTFGSRTIPAQVTILDEGMLHSQDSNISGASTWTGNFTLADDAKVHTGRHRINITGAMAESAPGATLDKQGSGILSLSGRCTYTGSTSVTTGTLLIDGDHGVTGSSAVTVSSGATLGGSGRVRGHATVNSGGDIAPGDATSASGGSDPVGTLRVASLALTGDYLCEIDGKSSDILTVDGNLAGASTPNFQFSVLPGGVTQDFYVVATYGTQSGSFSASGTPSGYTFNHNTTAKRFELRRTASGYATWINSFTVPGAGAIPLADPDGDGFTNFDEYLFGTSPLASTGSLVSVSRSGSNVELRWLQRTSGNTYTPQQSTTLAEGSWTTVSSGGGITLGNDPVTAGTPGGYTRRLLTFNVPTTGPRRFVRIIGQ